MTWFSTLNNKDITQRDYFKYDDKGNMIKKSRYNYRDNRNDSTFWEHSYKYDNNGNLIEKNSNKPDYRTSIKKETCKYNWRGRKTEENWYGFDDSLRLLYTFKFNKNGNSVETIRYVEGKQSKSKTKLDKKGNAIELNTFDDDGSVKYKYTYKYDKYGNMTEKLEYDLDGCLWQESTYSYKYDKTGNWIEMSSEQENHEDTTYQLFVRKIEYY